MGDKTGGDDGAQSDDGGSTDGGETAPTWAKNLADDLRGLRDFVGGKGGATDDDDQADDDDRADDDDQADDDVSDDDGDKGGGVRSRRQAESDVERRVREEMAKVTRERETEDRIDKIEEKVKERPPAKQSRLSRAFWGDVNR